MASAERPGAGGPIEAASVVPLRDGSGGLEVLLVERTSRGGAFSGSWVFPGGKVDAADRAGVDDDLLAARRAAVREAREEAGLVLAGSDLVPVSHWTPPPEAPRRFLTWFFLAAAGPEAVVVDGAEVLDHRWLTPAQALAGQRAGELLLQPPTWVTLERLAAHGSVADALVAARGAEPERFATRVGDLSGDLVAIWHGDAAYAAGDLSLGGGRHRLVMAATGWRYELVPGVLQ